MKLRRQICGVLQGFLGTFTSRYSDYGGYWLFGQLARVTPSLRIDLMSEAEPVAAAPVLAAAGRLARERFWGQLEKRHLPRELIAAGSVVIERKRTAQGPVTSLATTWHDVLVCIEVISDLGKTYWAQVVISVRPHDPAWESQRRQG